MVICCIGEFLHHPAELFFCFECIQVGALILQCIKVALHWGVVIRISGLAHAPDHMGGLTEFRKGPGGVLTPLVTVQDQVFYDPRWDSSALPSVRIARSLVIWRSVMLAITLRS